MRKSGIYQYYVEGEDERSLLNTLKLDLRCIESGNFLKRQKGIKEVICIPQVRNLEDELVRACNIKNIVDLTKSLTKADYKRDLINCSNLSDRLKKCKFDITKIWAEIPKNNFKK